MEKIKQFLNKYKFRIIPLGIVFLLVNYISRYFRFYKNNTLESLTYLTENPAILLEAFPISFNMKDLLISLTITLILLVALIEKQSNKKKFRKGVEHGSAKWGVPKEDLKGMYNEKNDMKNIVFTEKIKMAINNNDLPSHKYHRNKNTIIIGGSGSGKTRFFVKPNIMQMNSDYVITDPKGSILNELGYLLRSKKNYDIKVLNLIEFDKSMRYNPLAYVKNEQDILKVVETIIKNTSAKDAKEDFWVTTEKLLYQALLSAILDYFPEKEKNLGTLSELLALFEIKENDEDYESAIDYMFSQIEEENPNSFSLKQYKAFKLSAGETAKSILISCATRLAPLNIPAVRELLSSDELKLNEMGNKPLLDEKGNIKYDKNNNIIYQPTALFIIVPDTDTTFNFIASIMYTQMFNLLVTIADTKFAGELPRHIRFILDEFANIGEIPEFQTLIATIRSRNISATPILQTLSQLKSIYKDNSDTIVGNCDTLVFLGGKEESTLKMISGQLGKQTIDDYNTSRTRSQSDSFGQNYSKLGRELMTPSELQEMDRSKAIVMITNLPPFIDNKYDIENHPNYKYHGKPPKIDTRTNKVIEEGKFWFDTDRYVNNYRKIYNDNIKLNKNSNTNEKNKLLNNEKEYELNKNTLEDIVKDDPNFQITVNLDNSTEIPLLEERKRIKTNKKPEKAV